MTQVNVYHRNGSAMDLMIVMMIAMNLCVVLIHSLTVLMEDVSNGIHGVMETMTAETTAMKMNVQVKERFITKSQNACNTGWNRHLLICALCLISLVSLLAFKVCSFLVSHLSG